MPNPWVDPQGWADEWNAEVDAAIAESDCTPEGLDAALKKHCAPLVIADLNYELPIMKAMRERQAKRKV